MKNSNKGHYSEEFKKEAVLNVKGQNASANRVSRDLGVSQSVLNRWVRQFKQEGSSVFGQEGIELNKGQENGFRLYYLFCCQDFHFFCADPHSSVDCNCVFN